MRIKWTDKMIENETREIASVIGKFPSVSYLLKIGRGKLANQIARRGGFLEWSNRLGIPRDFSDSDFGWAGEVKVCELLARHGFEAQRTDGVKEPYDILVNRVARIDVKTANCKDYGIGKAWHYRIGKTPSSDVMALYQFDTGDCYFIPWLMVPPTSVTIVPNGGKYAKFKNDVSCISKVIRDNEFFLEATQ